MFGLHDDFEDTDIIKKETALSENDLKVIEKVKGFHQLYNTHKNDSIKIETIINDFVTDVNQLICIYTDSITSLNKKSKSLSESIEKEKKEKVKIVNSFDLIRKIVSYYPDKENHLQTELDRFKKIILNDFLNFTRKDSYKKNTENFKELQKVIQEIEELINLKFIANKTVIGVGGGFSAGKSSFINSILNFDILPRNVTPTTAIPTYLINSDSNSIEIKTATNNLIEITEEEFKSITHNQSISLNTVSLIDFAVVRTKNINHENIVILDTPGYSKPDLDMPEENTDYYKAKKQLENTDALFWLIDIESGTLPNSDISFIKSMNYKNPIVFIVNKADKKNDSDINMIVKQVEQTIIQQNLPFYGVVAYSSANHKEYNSELIKSYLNEMNRDSFRDTNSIELKLNQILNEYDHYFESQDMLNKNYKRVLNQINNRTSDDFAEDLINDLLKDIKEKEKVFLEVKTDFFKIKRILMNQFNLIESIISENEKKTPKILFRQAMDYLYNHNETENAINLFYQLAEEGYPDAMFKIAELHNEGNFINKDHDKALKYYHLAAEKGHPEAQFEIGEYYQSNEEIEQAIIWFQKASDQNHSEAQYILGQIFEYGISKHQDRSKAKHFYTLASNNGHINALEKLKNL
ncbi:MAG TPA: dynamin family protein [Candidatus Cloacimonadota bacterium]|nr:dynamin family protein [Candidatus Cloacimonadota bacterium]